MPPRSRPAKDTPAKLAKRMSRVGASTCLRAKGEIRSTGCASDNATAAVQFMDEVRRNRITVQELA